MVTRFSLRMTDRGMASDRGEIISGWLIKISVVLIVVAVVGFDAISSGVLRMQVKDAAINSAKAGVNETSAALPTPQTAYNSASSKLAETHPEFTLDPASVIVGADGSVTVTVSGHANTLVAGRIKQLDKWTNYTSTQTAYRAK